MSTLRPYVRGQTYCAGIVKGISALEMVLKTCGHKMAEHDVNISQRASESPIRTKWVGGRSWFIAIAVIGIWANIAGINFGVKESNKLEKQKLEEMRKQYSLDSLKFEYIKSQNLQKVP